MCEMLDESRVSVCDTAIERYRERLGERLGGAVSFTHVDYRPTLVECLDPARVPEFQGLVRELMDAGADAP
ncbi:MAG TPA: hypothetical protein VKF59_06370 [Candidatus Dormibacteraeota bacterium]|nr:hypothetical protein [Candidatus Dormibacteraeota bacterium]